jgi:hypothetical protein
MKDDQWCFTAPRKLEEVCWHVVLCKSLWLDSGAETTMLTAIVPTSSKSSKPGVKTVREKQLADQLSSAIRDE